MIPPPPRSSSSDIDVTVPYKVAKEALVDQFERGYVRAVLEAAGGNMTKAARMAGIDRMYLHRLVQKHGARDRDAMPSVPDAAPSSARKSTPGD